MSIKCKLCVYSVRFKKGPFETEYFVQCTKYGSGRCKNTIPEDGEIEECKYYIERGSKGAAAATAAKEEKGVNIRKWDK